MAHLSVRVAWHDNRWNGTVCRNPLGNSFCLDLDRIREARQDEQEVSLRGKHFADLEYSQLPPCMAESAAFMTDRPWHRLVEHPYAENKKAQTTHGHLQKTILTVPKYSTFAVPFYWMLRQHQEEIEQSLPNPLPPDSESPFPSPWVFSKERQEAICDLFFGRLTVGKSLVLFYTKGGHPLGEAIPRLLVGIGEIQHISPILKYQSGKLDDTYPLWDRMFSHSIRFDGSKGFLLPYHDYLEPTGDPGEDARRASLLNEIAVAPEESNMLAYSYAGELIDSDVTLSALARCLEVVRKVRAHGIAPGPWEAREDWLNQQIAKIWQDRGAFPGTGAALEALGMRLGSALMLELRSKAAIKPNDDPWPLLDSVLAGRADPPQQSYKADIKSIANTWAALPEERRALLKLLSRFSLTPEQARRWFEPNLRAYATSVKLSDQEILQNPYRISEVDLGDASDAPVSISVIDRGLLADSTVAANHPIPAPSNVESALDQRRVRAALVAILRRATKDGDALLSEAEAFSRLEKLDLNRPCIVPSDWLSGNAEFVCQAISRIQATIDASTEGVIHCLQLIELEKREEQLRKVLEARAKADAKSLNEDWEALLKDAIKEGGGDVDKQNPRHSAALAEQSAALERMTTKKLTVLVGKAGTGKTTVLGALVKSKSLNKDGILFLAPTGKARVRLAQKANAEAMTVAQFLNKLKRYDQARQRVLFEGNDQWKKEKTVVIDEASMLTMDDLLAVFKALDMGHVTRFILVGDPNQLPPIGTGRPFADLVAHLDGAAEQNTPAGKALARLSIELRTAAGGPSDTLRLASWFTRELQTVDSDKVLSSIELDEPLNDLEIRYWKSPDDLRARLSEELCEQFDLSSPQDVEKFNLAFGLTKEGWVPFDNHDGAELFQILSPVRAHPHGIYDLNRWIQKQYRAQQLQTARQPWGLSLGDEEIVWGDKVILTRNGNRDGWDGSRRQVLEDVYLANGEIGVACSGQGAAKGKFLNIAFAGRPNVRFGFGRRDFSKSNAPLELAYALTVHKAQGSEFGVVFVVIPRRTKMLSRELIYTAITRARKRLVLFIEGDDRGTLYELAKPSNSDTARRNTNIFTAGIRRNDEFPYAAHLVHRTVRNEMVQSKSELAIANYLAGLGLDYIYNRQLVGEKTEGYVRPDFTFITDSGDVLLWEHLGMLDRDDYRRGWEWKSNWYRENGFEEGRNLFTSTEGPGLDMARVSEVAEKVKQALNH